MTLNLLVFVFLLLTFAVVDINAYGCESFTQRHCSKLSKYAFLFVRLEIFYLRSLAGVVGA